MGINSLASGAGITRCRVGYPRSYRSWCSAVARAVAGADAVAGVATAASSGISFNPKVDELQRCMKDKYMPEVGGHADPAVPRRIPAVVS
jgi:hypothetical protein